ncbi:MAG: RNA polymerase sigma factor [Rhodobacteraceae bacterium]|nr:RNA polymerase sigma factor [Paracoccaceae bacterium]
MGSSEFDTALLAALPKVRRYALSLCRKPDIADDLVQTTVERAVIARDRFDLATSMQAWLFRILRNAWIDQTRRNATRGTEVDIHDSPDAAIHDGDRAMAAHMALKETEIALATLPQDQQDVLRLVCFEELSYAEAAEVLDIPKGTVMSRLARARIALAEKMGIN